MIELTEATVDLNGDIIPLTEYPYGYLRGLWAHTEGNVDAVVQLIQEACFTPVQVAAYQVLSLDPRDISDAINIAAIPTLIGVLGGDVVSWSRTFAVRNFVADKIEEQKQKGERS